MKTITDRNCRNTTPCPCRPGTGCPLDKLKIALIGGLDRLENRYRDAFRALGAELYFHPGHCAGSGSNRLRAATGNADLVVFITSINSHNALQVVKGLCKKSGKQFIVMRETGPERVSQGIAARLNPATGNPVAARR